MANKNWLLVLLVFLLFWSCTREKQPLGQQPTEPDKPDIVYGEGPFVTQPQTDIPWPSLANSPWPMAHGNPQCVARSKYRGPQTGEVIWQVSLGNGSVGTSPVIGEDGTIYVTALDNEFSLFAVSQDGNIKWKFHPGRHIESGPMISKDGTIYLGAGWQLGGPLESGAFYALNPDGTIKWEYELNSFTLDYGDAIGLDGTIYFTASDGYLYALNPDGTLQLKTRGIQGFASTLANSIAFSPDGLTLYATGFWLKTLHAVNARDGSVIWSLVVMRDAFRNMGTAPTLDSYGNLYYQGYDSDAKPFLFCINPDGSAKWKSSIPAAGGQSDMVIDQFGNIYFGNLYKFDPSGKLVWKRNIKGFSVTPLICDSEGTIYFCDYEGVIYAISNDGEIKFIYDTNEYFQGGGAIGENGIMYFGTGSDGQKLWAIH